MANKMMRAAIGAVVVGTALFATTARNAVAQIHKTAASPAPGTMWLYPERIRLQDGSYATAERGFLFVPLNRKNPKSDVVGVEVYRFRADKSANPSTPPLFFLPGGPNFGGLEPSLARPGYYEREVKPYLSVADFIVVGQRGIGSSKPTTVCERPRAVALDATEAQLAQAAADGARRCKDFWTQAGVDVSGFNVIEAAADIEDLRKAFGYDKIQIWGGSFGSHWAMATLRYYPQNITRVVLRGIEGPDNTYDSPIGVANALSRIAAAADTAAAFKGKVPPGGFFKAFQEVIARLDKNPAMVTVTDSANGAQTVRVDGDAIRNIAVTGARAWPAMVLALYNGDYTNAARIAIRNRRVPGVEVASYYMLDCGSGITPERAERFRTDAAGLAVVGDVNWEYHVTCPIWQSDNGAAFRKPYETNTPIIIVQGDWDTSTPMENSLELKPFFKNSRYVLVKGGSHGSLAEAINASPEFFKQMLEFYATGDMNGIPDQVVLPTVNWVVR